MFDRIANSFELARSSWRVLRDDKKLIVFPLLSGFCCLVVLATFLVPIGLFAQAGGFQGLDEDQPLPPWVYVVAFAFYFCNYFVIVFFNAALVSCALMRFAGEEPTLGDGLRAAAARLPQIAAWALVSATVGVVLKAIENAHEKAGEIISAILGTAWTVLTYFVVPVLVVERLGPVDAVKRSVQLLKKTWGEALVGKWGLGFFLFLLLLPGLGLLFLGGWLATQNAVLGLAVVAGAVTYFLAWGAAGSALNAIFLSALYQYAAYETVPVGFDERTVRGAFGHK